MCENYNILEYRVTVADLRGRKIRFRAYTLSEDNGVIVTNNNSRDNPMHAFRIRPKEEVIHYITHV